MTSNSPQVLDDSPQEQLIAGLREVGGYSGNIALQRQLEWDDDKYWKTRDSLVDAGRLRLGRGRGGTVQLVEAAAAVPAVPAASPPGSIAIPAAPSEEDLYGPVSTVLRGDWAKDNRYRQLLVEITANQGRRATGGTWTRPDIVVAALRVFSVTSPADILM